MEVESLNKVCHVNVDHKLHVLIQIGEWNLQKSRAHERHLSEAKLVAEKKAETYLQGLNRAKNQLRVSEKAQLVADEKIRRLSELLDDAKETAAKIRKENNILTSNIANLQTGVLIFTDDEVEKEMTVLYHDLERWILSHIRVLVAAQPGFKSLNVEDSLVAQMQSEISGLIHQNFWTSAFVGCGTGGNQYMTDITNVIGNGCKFRELCGIHMERWPINLSQAQVISHSTGDLL